MSLLPFLFNDSSILPPIKILDQYFAVVLKPEDLQQPETVPRLSHRSPTGYLRTWRPAAAKGDLGSTISFDEEKYQAILDVQQFLPEELSVTATGNNTVIVEGKHGEKVDKQGQIQRQFVRRYILPKNCDMDKVEAKLSSDGILTITAPRVGENPVDQKNILIIQTGEPGREIEQVLEKCEKNPEKKCENEPEKKYEKSPEKKCEKPPEKKCEKPPEKKYEKPPEKKCEKHPEKKCEKPPEKKCEKPPEKKCEKPSGKKCEKPPEKKCEKPSEKKCEKLLEKKCEKPSGKKM